MNDCSWMHCLAMRRCLPRSDEIDYMESSLTEFEWWESEYAPQLLRYQRAAGDRIEANYLLGREGRWWIHDSTVRQKSLLCDANMK